MVKNLQRIVAGRKDRRIHLEMISTREKNRQEKLLRISMVEAIKNWLGQCKNKCRKKKEYCKLSWLSACCPRKWNNPKRIQEGSMGCKKCNGVTLWRLSKRCWLKNTFVKSNSNKLKNTIHCTEMRFASFLSGGLITVVNPLERKLAKRTSLPSTIQFWTIFWVLLTETC